MKKFIISALMIFVATGYSVLAQYSGGDGSDDNPYQIKTTGDLIKLSKNLGHWNQSFILTADITFPENEQSFDWNDNGTTNDGSNWNTDPDDELGFLPIGNDNNKFEGQFNGNGHTISNLYIKRSNLSHIGLFGYVYEATIENIGIVNCNITGNNYVGGLVGWNVNNSTISNSYSTGSVSGNDRVGGLVGWNVNNSTISNSYSMSTVSGNENVGGLVGWNVNNSTISNSYSRGTVTRKSGSRTQFGGFCGTNSATIEYCYSTGKVLDESNNNMTNKGFVGYDDGGTYRDNFFDSDASNQTSSDGATAKTTAEMKDQTTFGTWDFTDTWGICTNEAINDGYPYLKSHYVDIQASAPNNWTDGSGGTISTLAELRWLSETTTAWDEDWVLGADIDATSTKDWNCGEGFSPIGNNTDNFTGTFDGKGYKISNLYINRPNERCVGLFGRTYGSTIENIGIVDCNITGYEDVGGLVGYHLSSTISNSYSTGTVSGTHNFVGGLVGENDNSSTVRNSYSTGTVSGGSFVGGLVGFNSGMTGASTVRDSYSTATVSGINNFGGLVGYNSSGSTISNSYSTGTVTRKSGPIGISFGGFCGTNYSSTIEYCYSTGKVLDEFNNNMTDKGFVGNSSGSPTYQHNFFDSQASEQNGTAGDASATTTENMKKQSTFPNWKFGQNENWTMDPKLNEGYPVHQWADNSGPSVASFSPANGSTDIELAANLVITFDEMLIKGTGNIIIYKSDGTKIETIDVASAKVTIEGNQATINPNSDLADGVEHYIQIAGTCFKDVSGNFYAGINDNTTWTFTAKDTNPIVSTFSPEDNAPEVSIYADLVVTFDETIVANQGNITIYKFDGTEFETIDVTSDNVTISGNKVTINPNSDLADRVEYYVQIAGTCFKDASGNSYAGIDDNTTWNFTAKLEAVTFKPANGTARPNVEFAAAPTIDANKTVRFIGFQVASNYEMTQNLLDLEDGDAEERGYILVKWNNYTYRNMYYCRYVVRYTDGTEDYGPVSAFIKNEGTAVIKIGE